MAAGSDAAVWSCLHYSPQSLREPRAAPTARDSRTTERYRARGPRPQRLKANPCLRASRHETAAAVCLLDTLPLNLDARQGKGPGRCRAQNGSRTPATHAPGHVEGNMSGEWDWLQRG